MALKQKERPVAVVTPLGGDALVFRRMTANEEMGRLFEFELELLSEDDQIDHDKILGQNINVRVNLPGDEERHFNGFATRFAHVGSVGRFALYEMTLRPWLWFLTRTADCRIFQEKTVPDIIKEVFREHGFTDFEESLSASYRTWNYCVQYRETDFNFVSRLMEQEGIYYYFKHEENKHTLVLADSYSAHVPFPGYEEIPFLSDDEEDAAERDHFFDWNLAKEVQSGAYALSEFDFENPKADLSVKSSVSRDHGHADYEIYDYPGEYVESGDGDNYVRSRIEELQTQHETMNLDGNARGMTSGYLFKLVDCPRDDQNREYLVVSVNHDLADAKYESGDEGEGATYTCNVVALDSKTPFRAARVTPKPSVVGPQTAMVVGKSGEEIWTDKYGRVKVQFPWDRYGKADENSSCWVRVAQVWAGKSWGGIQVPRMGQEVIVEFLEGDPDRPIITGRVYNADSMPPYDLPANQTQSGMKSRSSKEGSGENFNEIRLEDKKGEEEVYIHAEKDHNQVTENDRTEDVGNNRSLTVGNDKSESVGNEKSIGVGKNHSEDIGENMTLSVGGDRSLSVAKNMTESVEGNASLAVTKNLTETVDGEMSLTITKDRSTSIGKNLTLDVAKDSKITVAGQQTEEITKKYTLKAKAVLIEAEDELIIKVGKAKMQLKKNGDISVNGKKINMKGSGDIVMKGSKIKQN